MKSICPSSFCPYYQTYERLKKLINNTSKNPEHCCQAFEYLRDELQKILGEEK